MTGYDIIYIKYNSRNEVAFVHLLDIYTSQHEHRDVVIAVSWFLRHMSSLFIKLMERVSWLLSIQISEKGYFHHPQFFTINDEMLVLTIK